MEQMRFPLYLGSKKIKEKMCLRRNKTKNKEQQKMGYGGRTTCEKAFDTEDWMALVSSGSYKSVLATEPDSRGPTDHRVNRVAMAQVNRTQGTSPLSVPSVSKGTAVMALSLKSLRSASESSEAGEEEECSLCPAPCDCRAVGSLGDDEHHSLCPELFLLSHFRKAPLGL